MCSTANAALYWERESRHDTVISLTYGRPALDAFCRVMSLDASFPAARVAIKPVRKIDEPRWAWHVGLDAESTAILNELWSGGEIEPGRMRNPRDLRARVRRAGRHARRRGARSTSRFVRAAAR